MESNKQHFRHVLLFYFRKGKSAVQARKKLMDVYGEGVLTVRQCQNWFAKFRSGKFDVEDAPRSGRPVEADKDAIKALVDANRRITTREIGERLNLSNSTVYGHLKDMGLTSKLDVKRNDFPNIPIECVFPDMAHPPLCEFVKFGKKILGAGINYRSLIAARNLPLPKEPIIFLKCSTSYITEGQSIIVPPSFNVNQEVELGVVIGKIGKNIKENEAFDYVGGYCLALDMTEGGLMDKCRKEGLPWTIGKAFDTACPVSRFISKDELCNPEDVRIFSKVNNKVEQDSSTSDLLFTIPKLISFVSQFITLEPGDLILTGSPAGAGPVKPGDVIECGIGSILTMKFPVKSG